MYSNFETQKMRLLSHSTGAFRQSKASIFLQQIKAVELEENVMEMSLKIKTIVSITHN